VAALPNPERRSVTRRFERLEEDVRKLKIRGGGDDPLPLADFFQDDWYDAEIGSAAGFYRQGGRVWLYGTIYYSASGSVDSQIPFKLWPEGYRPAFLQKVALPVAGPQNQNAEGLWPHVQMWPGHFFESSELLDQGYAFEPGIGPFDPESIGNYPPDLATFDLGGVSFIHE
jgi:hypothetical protein